MKIRKNDTVIIITGKDKGEKYFAGHMRESLPPGRSV